MKIIINKIIPNSTRGPNALKIAPKITRIGNMMNLNNKSKIAPPHEPTQDVDSVASVAKTTFAESRGKTSNKHNVNLTTRTQLNMNITSRSLCNKFIDFSFKIPIK